MSGRFPCKNPWVQCSGYVILVTINTYDYLELSSYSMGYKLPYLDCKVGNVYLFYSSLSFNFVLTYVGVDLKVCLHT